MIIEMKIYGLMLKWKRVGYVGFLFWLLLLVSPLRAQSHSPGEPVKWEAKITPALLPATGSGRILLTAHLSKPWHIYSLTTPIGGPLSTQVTLLPGSVLTQAGAVNQPKPTRHRDAGFGIMVETFSKQVTFVIPFKRTLLKGNAKNAISTVQVRYQACNGHLCLPPKTVNVTVPLH